LSRETAGRWLAAVVAAVAVLVVLAKLPSTLRALNSTATHNDSYDSFGRNAAAAADSLSIDTGFVLEADQLVAPGATYTVVRPSAQAVANGTMSEITYDALSPYMRYVLLPRREVAPRIAQYVLCYGCKGTFRGVRWIWDAGPDAKFPGIRIGRRETGG
jgi:hypothetical protein